MMLLPSFFLLSSLSLASALSSTPASAAASATVATPSSTFPTSTAPVNSTGSTGSSGSGSSYSNSTVPDVYLNVPQLSVGRIELDVDNLQADINLNADVAGLVQINAGVTVSVQKVNITISDVDAQLELVVRLSNLVNIVNRVFQSLDLNPLLISALNDVTNVVDTVIGAVDGLLGTITQGGTTLSFIVDNLGNIVQQVAGAAGSDLAGTSQIVGNYLQNMTFTGVEQTLSGGNIQKTYSYSPLNALVNIVFNSAGQVVSAVVQGAGDGASSTTASAATASTAAAKRRSY
ncbi:hypothetical protein MMC20_002935 [Loxospora ochrophaea]|nr:hypothetical protein [Loxospora ochrophaea]